MHLIAAAEITPSGVPPIPHSRSTGELSPTRQQRRRHVAVDDQPHPGAGRADLAHRLVVALAVEHHDHHVADVGPLALGDQPERLAGSGRSRSSRSAISGPPAIFSMYTIGPGLNIVPRSASAITEIALGIPSAVSARALERVDRDVDLRRAAVADLLAVVEHRRLVLLPLPITTTPSIETAVEHVAHRVDGRLVGTLLVAAADHPRAPRAPPASVTRTSSSARLRSGRVASLPMPGLPALTGPPEGYAAEPPPARATPRRRPSAGSPPAR